MDATKTMCNRPIGDVTIGSEVWVPQTGNSGSGGDQDIVRANITRAKTVGDDVFLQVSTDKTDAPHPNNTTVVEALRALEAMGEGAADGGTWVRFEQISLANEEGTMVTNCLSLPHKSAVTIADNLETRLSHGLYISKIGEIYVSVNPGREVTTTQPFVGPAEEIHKLIFVDGIRNFDICISGISGSGKTHSTATQVRYLVSQADSGQVEESATDVIRAVIPIVELFGNAATPNNHNSSRVSIAWTLTFDADVSSESLRLIGFRLGSSSLESGRVFSQGAGERNFHVFYVFLAACRDKYNLGNVIPAYFCDGDVGSSGQATTTWDDLETQWLAAGFGVANLEFVELILASILHMGQARADLAGDDPAEESDALDAVTFHLGQVEELWGLVVAGDNPVSFQDEILRPALNVGTTRMVTASAAASVIDSCAANLYSALFKWIVALVNEKSLGQVSGASPATNDTVTVTFEDDPGFESMLQNGLAQMTVNHGCGVKARDMDKNFIKAELQELRELGAGMTLDGSPVEIPNAGDKFSEVADEVQALMKNFDDAVSCGWVDAAEPDARTVSNYLEGAKQRYAGRLSEMPIALCPGSATRLRVKHYAGTVEYETLGMTAANAMRIRQQLKEVLLKAPGLKPLHAILEGMGHLTGFKAHDKALRTHQERLKGTKVLYQWCFCPRSLAFLAKQCRDNGCDTHLIVAESGFPHKIPLNDTRELLAVVLERLAPEYRLPATAGAQEIVAGGIRKLIEVLGGAHGLTESAVAVGTEYVAFKANVFTRVATFYDGIKARSENRARRVFRAWVKRYRNSAAGRAATELRLQREAETRTMAAVEAACAAKDALLVERVASLTAEITDLRSRLDSASQTNADLEKSCGVKDGQLVDLQSIVDRVTMANAAEVAALTATNADLRSRLDSAFQTNADLEKSCGVKDGQLVDLRSNLELLMAAKDEQLANMAESRDAEQTKVCDLEARLGELARNPPARVEDLATSVDAVLCDFTRSVNGAIAHATDLSRAGCVAELLAGVCRSGFGKNFSADKDVNAMYEEAIQLLAADTMRMAIQNLTGSRHFGSVASTVVRNSIEARVPENARFGLEYDSTLVAGTSRLAAAARDILRKEGTASLGAAIERGPVSPSNLYTSRAAPFMSKSDAAAEAAKEAAMANFTRFARDPERLETFALLLARNLERALVRETSTIVGTYVYYHAAFANDEVYARAMAVEGGDADPAAGVGGDDATDHRATTSGSSDE